MQRTFERINGVYERLPGSLVHPFGLSIITASVAGAAVVWLAPGLERFSGSAVWIGVAGAVAYVSVVTVSELASAGESIEEHGGEGGRKKKLVPMPSGFPQCVDEAVKVLNEPDGLSGCQLAVRIPLTVERHIAMLGQVTPAEDGPLARARALRQVIIAAIERLNPGVGPVRVVTPAAHPYIILHDAYVQGRKHKAIQTALRLPEGRYWTTRTKAVRVVAVDIWEHEQELAAT